ncbi:MAG: hypothetical protein H6623_07475 [Bdellovibrionaceae bacterium]|nr:hypothetical protein [Pseudobdellovibrionaceae bacterium]
MNLARKHVLLVFALCFLPACFNKNGGSTEVATNPEQGPLSVFDANMYPLNKVVCDPFDPGVAGPNDGLVAHLYYRGQGQDRWYNTLDYLNLGQQSPQTLFFSSLDVPTRLFDQGFPTETGSSINDDAGNRLMEYFALTFSSVLKLTADDEDGDYEFALLSDDGAVMYVRDSSGQYQPIVNNDGDHPTRMGCGQKLTLDHSSELVIKLDYYQGPRYHISLVPMWRKVSSATTAEPLCGHSGNSLFFDYNNNSTPQAAYNQLLSRGWKPIASGNWNLPAFAVFNPCTTGTVPVISNFQLVDNVEGFVSFSWTTDIPATSQLLFTDTVTGVELLTTADNRLRISHLVNTSSGLTIGKSYEVRAISISADYGKQISNPITVTIH